MNNMWYGNQWSNTNQRSDSFFNTKHLNPFNCYELPTPPSDSISRLSWCPTKNIIAAASWNKTVSIWRVDVGSMQNQYKATPMKMYSHQAPVLCCFVTQHDNCIKTIHHVPKINIIITGGWDKRLRFWDARFSNNRPVLENGMPERVYAADVRNNIYVVGCGGNERMIGVYDLRKPKNPLKSENSPLRMQTRCVAIFPNQDGYVIGSIEGRVGVQFFMDNQYGKKKSFAFKCHREGKDQKSKRNCFAINDISFNNKFGTFATCGSNGRYHFWNKDEKRRVFCMKKRISCSVTSGKWNGDGSIYAVGVSYDFSQGTELAIFKNKQFGSKILLHTSKIGQHR